MSPDLQRALQLHQSGESAAALPLYAQVLAAEPDAQAALFYGGVAAWTTGDAALALQRLDRLVSISTQPAAEAHYHRALALAALGRDVDAIADCETAIRLKPGMSAAHNNLGELRRKRREFAAADAAFAAALQIDPGHIDARHNRGLNAFQSSDLLYARALLAECVRRDPDHVSARITLVDVLSDLGERDEALALARASCRRLPDAALLWNALGQAEHTAGHFDDALAAWQEGLRRAPGEPILAMNLAQLQNENADIDAARHTYAVALATKEHAGLRFRLATLLPTIPQSEAEIDEARLQFRARLAELRDAGTQLADPLNDFGDTPFYLSYQGRSDDRVLLADLAVTLCQAAPELAYSASHLDTVRRPGKWRIGFCSHFLYDHSVGRALHAFVAALPRDAFDVHLFVVPPPTHDAMSERLAMQATVHRLPFDLLGARELIASQALDMLVYPEIGMEALTYYLAHARLARRQWTTLGHPCTSGLPTIDTYVSFAQLETEDSARFYSEQLLRLPAGAPFPAYPANTAPPVATDRKTLGLPAHDGLLICPQSLFKLMPAFDATLAAILEATPDAILLLPEAGMVGQTAAIKARFAKTLGPGAERVHFFSRRSRAGFIELIAACDVLLDPFPVGGGISTWDALASGTPIVTLRGDMMRSLFASAALGMAGIGSTIANDANEYVAIVTRLLRAEPERAALRNKLTAAAPGIYQDTQAVDHWLAAVHEAIAQG